MKRYVYIKHLIVVRGNGEDQHYCGKCPNIDINPWDFIEGGAKCRLFKKAGKPERIKFIKDRKRFCRCNPCLRAQRTK